MTEDDRTDNLSNNEHSLVCKKNWCGNSTILDFTVDVKKRKALLDDVEDILDDWVVKKTKLMNYMKSCSSSEDTPDLVWDYVLREHFSTM